MFNKILVPLDGSPLAEGALPHALALSQAFKASVTLAHVLDREVAVRDTQVDPLAWHMLRAEGQSYLQRIGQRWAEATGTDEPPETVLLEGAAAEHIVGHAREQADDLIILSSHGRSGPSIWNVSSVAQKVLMRAFRSVLFVQATSNLPDDQFASTHYRRILVPLDGSKRAEGVLPLAQKLAEADDTEVIAAHVVQRPVPFRQPAAPEDVALVDEYVARNEAEASAYLQDVCGRLGPGARCQVTASESPALALIDMAAAEGADLVLLSAHGRTASHRPYGGLATAFIYYGSVPLLIYQDMPEDQLWLSTAAPASEAAPINRLPVADNAYA